MDQPDYIPAGYNRIQVVDSLSDLFNAKFGPANCILYPRTLTGDFNALARTLLKKTESRRDIKTEQLREITAGLAGGERQAAEAILADMEAVKNCGQWKHHRPVELRVLGETAYRGPDTTVHSFHADTIYDNPLGKVLCAYNDPVTEALRNRDAVSMADEEYDSENLYAPKAGAQPFRFRPGDLWRHAGLNGMGRAPKSIPPFIHRAPLVGKPDDPPRLLLVAG